MNGPAVAAALGAAVSFAMAAVLQQEAARSTAPDESLRLRLLLTLLRRPKWLAGVGLLISGYGLQALALSAGPVSLVQPIVATELAFAIPIAISRRRRTAGRREWIGIAAVLLGVSTFLWVASPENGTAQPDLTDWLLCLVPVGTAIVVLITVASRSRGPHRALLLGSAAGLAFALLAILTKAVTHNLGVGLGATFTNWEVYLLIALGISALVVSQSAYQAGPLALSMPAIAILEPAVAVIIGDTAFSEQARLSGASLAFELVAALVAAGGLLALASSPTVASIYAQGEPAGGPAPHRGGHGDRPYQGESSDQGDATTGPGSSPNSTGPCRPKALPGGSGLGEPGPRSVLH